MSKTKNAIKKIRNDKEKSLVKGYRVKSNGGCLEPLPDYVEFFHYKQPEEPEEPVMFMITIPGSSPLSNEFFDEYTLNSCDGLHIITACMYYRYCDAISYITLGDYPKCDNTGCPERKLCKKNYSGFLRMMADCGVDYNGSQ